jgi:hypothetical protein
VWIQDRAARKLQRWFIKIRAVSFINTEEIVNRPFFLIEKENVKYIFDSHWIARYFVISANFTNPYTQRALNIIEVKRLSKLIPASCRAMLMLTWSHSSAICDAVRASSSIIMDYEQRAGEDLDGVLCLAEDESDVEDEYDNSFGVSLVEMLECFPNECYKFLLRCKMLVEQRQRNLTDGGFETIVGKINTEILKMHPSRGCPDSRPGLCVWL